MPLARWREAGVATASLRKERKPNKPSLSATAEMHTNAGRNPKEASRPLPGRERKALQSG